ncbi:alanine racemase [Glycomyces paridis]|uniref:Diaminopimelate decarboxylase n=1 Tax=Glycomyces paridis TaxID=2126555 RepID=A0A4S8PNP6_9ACTN|nr:alanine racemase [Glycomyces paridis]THV30219.1 diaminopimelate decarboxylase [Glycomyces paridis]
MADDHRVQGVPVTDVLERHGSPAYIYDAERLRSQYRGLRAALHERVEVHYSLKANPNLAVTAVLGAEGAGAEVSSLLELETALRAGIGPERIIFLGPGKSRAELEACVKERIALVVVESVGECAMLSDIAAAQGVRPRVLLRVNPGFESKKSGLAMGGKPRQFGMDEEVVRELWRDGSALHGVEVEGLHVYMGTRILSAASIGEHTARILALAASLADETGMPVRTVDFGGGFGVPYFANEGELDAAEACRLVNEAVAAFLADRPETRFILESGRYLTAEAGIYAATVRYTKESHGERFAVLDGGSNHHMAAAGIGSFVRRNFPVKLLNRSGSATAAWNLTGPLCTPNDSIGNGVDLPDDLGPGDVVGILSAGAYGPTASIGRFLGHGFPAEILVDGGRDHLVRARDTVADMLGPQSLPPSLKEGA